MHSHQNPHVSFLSTTTTMVQIQPATVRVCLSDDLFTTILAPRVREPCRFDDSAFSNHSASCLSFTDVQQKDSDPNLSTFGTDMGAGASVASMQKELLEGCSEEVRIPFRVLQQRPIVSAQWLHGILGIDTDRNEYASRHFRTHISQQTQRRFMGLNQVCTLHVAVNIMFIVYLQFTHSWRKRHERDSV